MTRRAPSPLDRELAALLAADPRLASPDMLGAAPEGTPRAERVCAGADGLYPMTEIPVPERAGTLWVGRCPAYPRTRFDRDLDAIHAFGIRALVCLLPSDALGRKYGLVGYVEAARARFGEGFVYLPVDDYDVPRDDAAFEAAVGAVDAALGRAAQCLVHCGAGCGRTGVFVACVLVRAGEVDPRAAVAAFRARRGCGPETPEQTAYVARYAGRRRGDGDGG